MMNSITPEFVRVIHEQKEREIQQQIDLMRAIRERRAVVEGPAFWFAQAASWLKVNLFRQPVQQPVAKLVIASTGGTTEETGGKPCFTC